MSQLVLLTSINGDTFEPPVAIKEAGTSVSSHGENSPVMLFGPDEKIYTMREQQDGEAAAIMFATRSISAQLSKNRFVYRISQRPPTVLVRARTAER